jgi:hypothetical protein
MCRRFDPGPDHFDFLNVFLGTLHCHVPSVVDERPHKLPICTEQFGSKEPASLRAIVTRCKKVAITS